MKDGTFKVGDHVSHDKRMFSGIVLDIIRTQHYNCGWRPVWYVKIEKDSGGRKVWCRADNLRQDVS